MQSLPAKPEGLGISVRIEQDAAETAAAAHRQRQKDTVRWVLGTPRRLRDLIEQDRDEEAEREWAEISKILDKWKDVAGVEEVRAECEAIMEEEDDSG